MRTLAELTTIANTIKADETYQGFYNSMLAAEAEKKEKGLFSSEKSGKAMIAWFNHLDSQLEKHGINPKTDLVEKLTISALLENEGMTPERANSSAIEWTNFIRGGTRDPAFTNLANYLAQNPRAIGTETSEAEGQALMSKFFGDNDREINTPVFEGLARVLQNLLSALFNFDPENPSLNRSISPNTDLPKTSSKELGQ